MSSTASSFHNILGREEAEEKLVGTNRSYLSRRSPLNRDYYILSYQVNGKFNHEIVNCQAESVDFENVLREMIETNPNCEHAVIPLPSNQEQEVGEAGHVHHPEEADRPTVRPTIIPLRPQCYVCHLSFDNKRQRNKHLDDHKVRKCGNCGLFIPSKSYARHYKVCSKTPAPKCTQCDYTTHLSWYMKVHVKAVHGKEFSCSDCGKKFSCKKKLEDHEALHRGEHKCDQCPEVLKSVWGKYRHKMRKHTERRRVIINPNVGFFSIDTESILAEQRRHKPVHHCEKCDYRSDHKGHYNEHVKMHSRSPKKRKRKTNGTTFHLLITFSNS